MNNQIKQRRKTKHFVKQLMWKSEQTKTCLRNLKNNIVTPEKFTQKKRSKIKSINGVKIGPQNLKILVIKLRTFSNWVLGFWRGLELGFEPNRWGFWSQNYSWLRRVFVAATGWVYGGGSDDPFRPSRPRHRSYRKTMRMDDLTRAPGKHKEAICWKDFHPGMAGF